MSTTQQQVPLGLCVVTPHCGCRLESTILQPRFGEPSSQQTAMDGAFFNVSKYVSTTT